MITNQLGMLPQTEIQKYLASQGMLQLSARDMLGFAGGNLNIPGIHHQYNPLLAPFASPNLVIFSGQDLTNKYPFPSMSAFCNSAVRDSAIQSHLLQQQQQLQSSSCLQQMSTSTHTAPSNSSSSTTTSLAAASTDAFNLAGGKGSDGLELLADVISKNGGAMANNQQSSPLRSLRLVSQLSANKPELHPGKPSMLDSGLHTALFAKV